MKNIVSLFAGLIFSASVLAASGNEKSVIPSPQEMARNMAMLEMMQDVHIVKSNGQLYQGHAVEKKEPQQDAKGDWLPEKGHYKASQVTSYDDLGLVITSTVDGFVEKGGATLIKTVEHSNEDPNKLMQSGINKLYWTEVKHFGNVGGSCEEIQEPKFGNGTATLTCAYSNRLASYYKAFVDHNKAVIVNRRVDLEKAAAHGDAEAQNTLGMMYSKRIIYPGSCALALTWFQKAADHGYADAQKNLGEMYYFGKTCFKADGTQDVVEQDYGLALKWFQKAAGHGYAEAQKWLGVLYELGNGVPKDCTKAMRWYQKAAEQGGSSQVQLALGTKYYEGKSPCVQKNMALAKKWIKKAADNGNQAALENFIDNGLLDRL